MRGTSCHPWRPVAAKILAILLACTTASAQMIDGYTPDQARAGPRSGISTPKPAYPLESKQKREQATGVLRVFIGRTGSIDRVEIARFTGSLYLMKHARDHARRAWRAEPRSLPPHSKGRWRDVPITFVLDD